MTLKISLDPAVTSLKAYAASEYIKTRSAQIPEETARTIEEETLSSEWIQLRIEPPVGRIDLNGLMNQIAGKAVPLRLHGPLPRGEDAPMYLEEICSWKRVRTCPMQEQLETSVNGELLIVRGRVGKYFQELFYLVCERHPAISREGLIPVTVAQYENLQRQLDQYAWIDLWNRLDKEHFDDQPELLPTDTLSQKAAKIKECFEKNIS